MNRTPDLLITNELLYRLSYTGYGKNCSSNSAVKDIDGASYAHKKGKSLAVLWGWLNLA